MPQANITKAKYKYLMGLGNSPLVIFQYIINLTRLTKTKILPNIYEIKETTAPGLVNKTAPNRKKIIELNKDDDDEYDLTSIFMI